MNLSTTRRADGPLDVERFNLPVERTINRHEALRTCFSAPPESFEVQQHITRTEAFQLTLLQSAAESVDIDKQKAFDRIKEHVYPIETGDTLHATLFRHTTQGHTLMLEFHNIVIDVVSISLILSDIAREYQSST